MRRTIFICLFSISVLSYSQQNLQFVDVDMFEQLIDYPGSVVVDSRYIDDYKHSRIPQAQSVHKKELLLKLIDKLDREQYLLIYAHFRSRAVAVADIFIKKNFLNVYVLNSSFDIWVKSGKIIDDKRLKRREIELLK